MPPLGSLRRNDAAPSRPGTPGSPRSSPRRSGSPEQMLLDRIVSPSHAYADAYLRWSIRLMNRGRYPLGACVERLQQLDQEILVAAATLLAWQPEGEAVADWIREDDRAARLRGQRSALREAIGRRQGEGPPAPCAPPSPAPGATPEMEPDPFAGE